MSKRASLQLFLRYHHQEHPQPPQSILEGDNTTAPSGISIRNESGHKVHVSRLSVCPTNTLFPHSHTSLLLFPNTQPRSCPLLFGLPLGDSASGPVLFRIIMAWQVAAQLLLQASTQKAVSPPTF